MDERRSPIRVLIISDNEELSLKIQSALVVAQDVIVVGQCDSADRVQYELKAEKPDIALLDLRMGDSMGLLETLTKSSPTTAPIVLLPAEQMQQLQQALLAGARGFSLIPFRNDELLATIRQLHAAEVEKRQRQAQAVQTPAPPIEERASGQVITLCGIKGGIGRTFIAVNLAVALAQESKEAVALMEGHAGLGDVAPMLNTHPLHTLASLATNPHELDADLIRGALVPHASGIQVLFAAKNVEEGGWMTPELLAAAIRQLRYITRYVVVDTASTADEILSEALSLADVVLVVTTPEISSLRRATLVVQAARAGNFPSEKLRLVLNREGLPGAISRSDISQHLGVPIAIALPDDPALVTYSANRGVPLMQSHPKSLLARRIGELARQLIVPAQQRAEAPPPLPEPAQSQREATFRWPILPKSLQFRRAW